jgi:hypothetical protein
MHGAGKGDSQWEEQWLGSAECLYMHPGSIKRCCWPFCIVIEFIQKKFDASLFLAVSSAFSLWKPAKIHSKHRADPNARDFRAIRLQLAVLHRRSLAAEPDGAGSRLPQLRLHISSM